MKWVVSSFIIHFLNVFFLFLFLTVKSQTWTHSHRLLSCEFHFSRMFLSRFDVHFCTFPSCADSWGTGLFYRPPPLSSCAAEFSTWVAGEHLCWLHHPKGPCHSTDLHISYQSSPQHLQSAWSSPGMVPPVKSQIQQPGSDCISYLSYNSFYLDFYLH